VLRAARKVFLRYGVQKATMADIADEAGMPRPTLYEFVASRNDLIDAVIAARVRVIVDKLIKVVAQASSFAEAVVEASVLGIELTRTDRELANIFATTPYRQVHQIMEGPNPAIVVLVTEFLRPVIRLGTTEGVLRSDITEELLVGWFRAVYSGFIYREEVDLAEIRALMRTFLLPSLLHELPS
jgi:AcrR family transcriptional regulator